MTFNDAQYDMRYAYFGGGPGVLASGIVWIVAGLVALTVSIQASIIAIFFGGMLIHPLGMALSRALKRPGKHQSGNPLGTLAVETTILLFIGLFLAYSTAQFRAELFFPVMLLIVGGRYLMFSTMYGMRLYWLLGILLAGAGALGLVFQVSVPVVAIGGGIIEIVFSAVIINLARNMDTSSADREIASSTS